MVQSFRISVWRSTPPLIVIGGFIAAVAFLNIFNVHKGLVGDKFEYVAFWGGISHLGNDRRDLTELEQQLRSNATAMNRGNWSNSTRRRRRFELNLTVIDEAIEADSKRGTLRLPNILLIGAQKGGSSALAQWLFSHGVCRPTAFPGENFGSHRKEAHYFDRDERYEQGIKFYAKRFYNCTGATHAMDATPANFAYPERVRQAYDEAGNNQTENLKIVVILREPIARDLSIYNHKASLFREQASRNIFWKNAVDKKSGDLMPFEEYVRKAFYNMQHPNGPCSDSNNSFCYGLYAMFLKRWMKLFKHRQLLVLSYSELIENEAKLMWRLRTFIGLDDSVGATEIERVNSKHDVKKISLPPCRLQNKMAHGYEAANQEVYKLLAKKKVPLMEQRPFPQFVLSNCTRGSQAMSSNDTETAAVRSNSSPDDSDVGSPSGEAGETRHDASSAAGSRLEMTPGINIMDA